MLELVFITGVARVWIIIISLQKQSWQGFRISLSVFRNRGGRVQNIITLWRLGFRILLSVTGNKGGRGSEYHYQSSETRVTGVQNSIISHQKQGWQGFRIALSIFGNRGSEYCYQSSETRVTWIEYIVTISHQKQGWQGSEYHDQCLETEVTGVQNIMIMISVEKGLHVPSEC